MIIEGVSKIQCRLLSSIEIIDPLMDFYRRPFELQKFM